MIDELTPRSFITITNGLIAYARGTNKTITDYNIGSVARTLLEAPAIEINALSQSFMSALLAAIPIAIYNGFSFQALPASAASGYVTFFNDPDYPEHVVVPAGTLVRDPLKSVTYATQADAEMAANDTEVTVAVAATSVGTPGNAEPNTLLAYVPIISGVTVNNIHSITGGYDAESADAQRQRFARYIQSLARGTNGSLEYIALTGAIFSNEGLVIERAARIRIDESAGHVIVFVSNGSSATSPELIADIQRKIDGGYDSASATWIAGYRPAGMRVDVMPFSLETLDIIIECDVDNANATDTTRNMIRDAITAVLLNPPHDTLLRPGDILSAVLQLPPINGAVLLSPTTATTVANNTLLQLGTLTLTWA